MRHGQTSDLMRTILCMKTLITLSILSISLTLAACRSKPPPADDSPGDSFAGSKHNYKYSDLVIRDYDEMFKQVQARIKSARKHIKEDGEGGEREAIEELRDALKLIFSRPNSDNMVAKLVPEVRRELAGFSAYEDTMSSIAAECLARVKEDNVTVARRSTDLFVLENMITEMKPEVQGNADIQRIVKRIADAKIHIPDDVIKDRKIRSMFKTKNPSEMADEILKALPAKK